MLDVARDRRHDEVSGVRTTLSHNTSNGFTLIDESDGAYISGQSGTALLKRTAVCSGPSSVPAVVPVEPLGTEGI